MISMDTEVFIDNPNRKRWHGKSGKVTKLMPDGQTLEVRMDEGPFAKFEECELLVRRPPEGRRDITSRLHILTAWMELTIASSMLDSEEREALVVGREGVKTALLRLGGEDKADIAAINLQMEDIYPMAEGETTAILPPADVPKDFDWEEGDGKAA